MRGSQSISSPAPPPQREEGKEDTSLTTSSGSWAGLSLPTGAGQDKAEMPGLRGSWGWLFDPVHLLWLCCS